MYILALDPLLQKLENLWGIHKELGCNKSVSAYADYFTITVFDEAQLFWVEDALKGYEGGLSMPWLKMHIYVLKMSHPWLYLEGEQVWNPLAEIFCPRWNLLEEFKPSFIKRHNQTEWQKKYWQAFALVHKVNKVSSRSTSSMIYNGLVEFKRDVVLGEFLVLNENLFQNTFRLRYLDNYQKSLAVL